MSLSMLLSTPVAALRNPIDLVHALKQGWREGVRPNAAEALREHPSLLKYRSLVVDLAYEEYCLLEEAGAAPDTESFCRELPAFRSEVREVIRGHRVLADHPELFDRIDVAWPASGDVYEGFTVVRELGRGAFARAYLAEDPDTGRRPVVLKLSPTPSGEARLLGTVRHSNVAEVHWARRVDGLSAICLRFEGAATLRDVVAASFDASATAAPTAKSILDSIACIGDGLPATEAKLPLVRTRQTYADAIAAIAERLAGALAYLHGRGIIHGDLKPSNVLLGAGGHPYLIDFNLSGLAGESLDRFGGTLPYMAPECVRRMLGKENDASPLADYSDVYSFGAVLFEALTGHLPFEPIGGDDMKVVAADLLSRQLAGPSALKMANVPSRLDRVVRRCLAVDPGDRPSAHELQRQLRRFVARRTHGLRLAAASAVVMAAVLGITGLATISPKEQALAAAQVAEPSTPDEHLDFGMEKLGQGLISVAETHFLIANAARPDARSAALLGFCRSMLGDDAAAVHWYQKALRIDREQPAWVYNNLAFSLTEVGGLLHNLMKEADDAASAAIDRDSGMKAAYHNRAWARFFFKLDRKKRLIPEGIDIQDLESDLQKAMTGQEIPDLFLLAASVKAATAKGHPDRLEDAMKYLQDGIRCGLSPSRIKGDAVLNDHLGKRNDFAAIPVPPGSRLDNSDRHFRLVSPLAR